MPYVIMLDIKLIRETPELVKKNIERFKDKEKLTWLKDLIVKDIEYRKLLKNAEDLRHKRNQITSEISKLKKEGKSASKLIKEASEIPEKIKKTEQKVIELKEKINFYLTNLPNIIHEKVPYGKDASDNKVIKKFGKPVKFNFKIKNHVEILENLGLADFDSSAKMSGNGFYILKSELGLLNQALIKFAIDFMLKKDYTYIEIPLMIRKNILAGAIDVKEFEKSIYSIEGEDLNLIGTSEHALLGIHAGEVFRKEELPKKYFSYSMCFRKEIGSHGINEKGLWRTHQFNKIEQLILCKPKESWKMFDELMKNSQELLAELELPYQMIEICTGDLSIWKARAIDFEVYRPTTGKYEEIFSLSNCTDYQTRKLNIRFENKENEREVVHALNNTVLATSRMMVAIIENYQQKDGTIKIPKVLQKYMDGKKVIGSVKTKK